VQALRERLGEWAQEAVDANGRWLQPVLRNRAFEDHLVKENGFFKPSGSCESTFAWAHLLYALDIRPGRGVLAWRVPTDGINPADFGQISLDIDGQALCHIVNLYREYTSSAPNELSRASPGSVCRLPFGTLSIHKDESKFIVSFQSGTPEELCAPRVPFSCSVQRYPVKHLRFEQEVVVAKYYNAIHHGVSDTRAVLPNPTCSLIERTRGLADSVRFLGQGRWDNPYLLTLSWLEEASRIKRRVSTNGGEDSSLIDDIITALAKMPDVVKRLREVCSWDSGNWEYWVKDILKEKFMFTKDQFHLVWTRGLKSKSLTGVAVERIIREELPAVLVQVLAQFKTEPAGTWRHILSEMASDAVALLDIPTKWVSRPGVVLELTQESEMWTADCQIRGQFSVRNSW
jgi:hypothetical protein